MRSGSSGLEELWAWDEPVKMDSRGRREAGRGQDRQVGRMSGRNKGWQRDQITQPERRLYLGESGRYCLACRSTREGQKRFLSLPPTLHICTHMVNPLLSVWIYFSEVQLIYNVNFCWTAKWFSYTYIHILFRILFHYGLSQDIEYSSLCYTVGSCCLSIFCIIVCIC